MTVIMLLFLTLRLILATIQPSAQEITRSITEMIIPNITVESNAEKLNGLLIK